MTSPCTHLLCERIGGDCSLAVTRSRGCRPGFAAKSAISFDEVRELLAGVDAGGAPAARLAQLVRAEALEGRSLLAQARDADPELADLLAPYLVRR